MEENPRVQILIKKCKRGDRRAFDELMSMFYQKVFGFAFKLSHNYEEASDITVEVFVRVYKSIGSFRNEANFTSWMFTIVKNVYIDRLKINKKYQHQSLDQEINTDEGGIQREIRDESSTPEEDMEERENRIEMLEIINTLPKIQAEPIKLYHIDGLGYEEIAEKLNVPLGTVKSRINRARKTLESKLGDFIK